VDEAWVTGTQLGEAVLEMLKTKQPFNKDNLEAAYVKRRLASWVEEEGRVAEKSRDGFQRGVVTGMIGMAMSGLTGGRLAMPGKPMPPYKRIPSIEEYYRGRISKEEIAVIRKHCAAKGASLHAELMKRCGWPDIPYDGNVLVSHQDALLLGGKVQAPAGFADHVQFLYPNLCEQCGTRICIEVCSGQAITPGTNGVPAFDREKCIHCGACLWNCAQGNPERPDLMNISFRAGTGGLHSAEN
jgi:electron-transferring-flavoprotein dehydrogenase